METELAAIEMNKEQTEVSFHSPCRYIRAVQAYPMVLIGSYRCSKDSVG